MRPPRLANVTPELQQKTFEQLKLALARVQSDGAPPAGLDANQALQLRGSAGAVLLDLVNAAKTPALQQTALGTSWCAPRRTRACARASSFTS